MGCFLACFGFKTKKKGRKSRNISSSVEQNHGSYLPLDSDVFIKLDTTEKHNALDSGIKGKTKEASTSKIKKKVSFNLNVEAYEPIQNEADINTFYLSDSEEEEKTKWEFNPETTSLMATLHYAQDSISSRIKSYPQNHRYHNCTDEIYEDIEDDDYELEDDLSSDEDKGDDHASTHGNDYDRDKNSVFRQNLRLKSEEIEGIESDRKKQALSVLSPVENLSQWRAVKAKVAPVRPEKENVELEQYYEQNTPKCHPEEERSLDFSDFKNTKNRRVFRRDQGCSSSTVAVEASLSNWLSLT
ncbi:uncharacterized protein [Henckelia pumila]|uniref:uncharacterized protein n=1 Tax=Henckelia pumila TaxID=405737 RepID=UPI003C6DC606